MTAKGFTLIELMVAVAIVGILSAVAYPSYTDYLRRGKISDALSSLTEYRVRSEQYYQDNRVYGSGTTCGATVPTSSYFTFTCATSNSNQSYLVTAENKADAGMGAAGSYTYTMNESNTRSTTKFKGNTVSKSCWLQRGNEC